MKPFSNHGNSPKIHHYTCGHNLTKGTSYARTTHVTERVECGKCQIQKGQLIKVSGTNGKVVWQRA